MVNRFALQIFKDDCFSLFSSVTLTGNITMLELFSNYPSLRILLAKEVQHDIIDKPWQILAVLIHTYPRVSGCECSFQILIWDLQI